MKFVADGGEAEGQQRYVHMRVIRPRGEDRVEEEIVEAMHYRPTSPPASEIAARLNAAAELLNYELRRLGGST